MPVPVDRSEPDPVAEGVAAGLLVGDCEREGVGDRVKVWDGEVVREEEPVRVGDIV